jgi:XrtJ-associated TM-motif-TM protein
MKLKSFFAVLALALIVALPARAQTGDGFGGCEDSPENPTLILAGLAGGAFAINSLRLRLRARRSLSNSK